MNRDEKRARTGFCINALYGIYTGILGFTNHSWWFIALAAYYIVLAVMRFAVLLSANNLQADNERFITRFVGCMCLFLAVTLAGITYLSISDTRGSKFHEIVMISIALYTFVKITLAIMRIAKREANVRHILKCLRSLALADAAVSMFALQRSMLVSFTGMSFENIRLMNALTGTAVYLLTAVLGINLIGGKHITMAKSKIIEANAKITETITGGYKRIESGVVDGYKKIETGVVDGYTKIEDKFIEQFLLREGESIEDARKRLKDKHGE